MDDFTLEPLPQPEQKNRRLTRILLLIWLGLGIIVGLILCYIVANAFRPAPDIPVAVNDVSEFPPNSVTKQFVNADFFDSTANKQLDTLPLEVVRDAAGNFTVFLARSTRSDEAIMAPRQCIVDWDDSLDQFLELCGGSIWGNDGKYLSGPAPRDLDRFPALVMNGKLYISLKLISGSAHP